jgi:hypothetical protein
MPRLRFAFVFAVALLMLGVSPYVDYGTSSGTNTVAPVGVVPNVNGIVLVSGLLTLEPADGTNPGVVSILGQTFAGAKTFSTSVAIGSSGTAITDSRRCSLTIDFPNITAGAENTIAAACTGITTTSSVTCSHSGTIEAAIMTPDCWVSSAGNVSCRTRNLNTVAAVDPVSQTYECRWFAP